MRLRRTQSARPLADVAAELGVPRRVLRAWLQRTYPRPPEERGRPWLVDAAQAEAARAHWRPRAERRRASRARVAAIAVATLTVLLGLVAAAAYWQAEAFVAELSAGDKHEEVEAARAELNVAPARPAVAADPLLPRRAGVAERERTAKTILLVGSDERAARPGDRRSDTIILVRLEPSEPRIAVLSIPRDLLLEVPGHGRTRVNTAYQRGGIALLTKTLREALGVEINHFFEVDFGGFQRLVATLGGVYLPIDARYLNRHDGTAATNFAEIDLHPGYQRVNGRDALAWVRFRHGDSDLVRAARQQLFLRETTRQVVEARWSVLRLRSLLGALAEATASDVEDVGTLWRIVRTLEETPGSAVTRHTIPAEEVVIGGAYYVQAGDGAIWRTVTRWLAVAPPDEPVRRMPPAASGGAAAPAPALVPDGGRGAQLAKRLRPTFPCAPTALPPGYRWPDADAARTYTLAGEPAAAMWATAGGGRSVLWTATTWGDPPTLRSPTLALDRGGREYEVWRESGRVRQVAWRDGDVRVWITNTLTNDLSAEELLQLADSCR